MNAKNKKGVKIVVVVALLMGAGAYFVFRKKKLTKTQKVTALLTNPNAAPGSNYISLISFEDGYIDAWYKAAQAGDLTFGYNNKVYKTRGGKLAII